MSAILTENDLSPNARTLWLKAVSAIELKNMDYAINLLQMTVKDAPGFLEGRKALRRAEIQKKKGEKKKFFNLSGPNLGVMKVKNRLKTDPAGALIDVEEILKEDPFNVEANDVLYHAAMRLSLPELGAFALETVREGHPENTAKMHELAQHYMGQDMPEKAAQVYRDIIKRDPTDVEAGKGEKDAMARQSMRRDRWEDGFREAMKSEQESLKLEAASRAGLTREQLEAAVEAALAEYAADQNNLPVVKRVAALYEQLEQWGQASSFYAWAFHLSRGDTALERKAGQMDERRVDEEIKRMDEIVGQMEAGPELDAKREELRQLKRQRNEKLIGEARERVERNPTDPQVRFELGQHLFNAEEFTEAIPHLQRARNNPHLRIRAILLLGRCYEAKNMHDLAETQMKEALGELTAMDPTKKEVLYSLALIAQKMGKKDDYLDYLKRIYEADYGYRDVAKRVEESYSSGN